jgi:hypothetical protein
VTAQAQMRRTPATWPLEKKCAAMLRGTSAHRLRVVYGTPAVPQQHDGRCWPIIRRPRDTAAASAPQHSERTFASDSAMTELSSLTASSTMSRLGARFFSAGPPAGASAFLLHGPTDGREAVRTDALRCLCPHTELTHGAEPPQSCETARPRPVRRAPW